MKKEALQNREARNIGDKLLNAVRLPDDEIDRIAGSPDLFERVRAGVSAAEAERKPATKSSWISGFAPRTAFAAVLLISIGFGVIGIARQFLTGRDAASIAGNYVPEIEIPEPAAVVPDDMPIPETAPLYRAYTRAVRTVAGRPQKRQAAAQKARQQKELQMGEFQALTYAGDSEEPGEGGRIVRVKLSPASLFAMGLDVPLENETDRITADLLIGADGVMKSVRLEKKN
jgi:hypothetical protein